ncbi:MAG: YncE family protein [Hyphomicrobiales bacterium]|nr:YncE family protein [Hyphomicrobiales bacterium]MBV9520082.1 YncE family protein [Hyphomicrobiales bacterium]
MVIGDDNKLHWDDAGKPVFTEPGKDEVVIVDIKNREDPKIVASLPLINTVVGPPTNLAITPDESLALVANSLAYQQDGAGWKGVPDNKLFVIDLKSTPPKLVGTVDVGKQPSGLAVNKSGNLLLIANRADSSVSVLTIKGQEVKLLDTIAMGDPVAAVAFTPDGKHGLAAKNTVNKVSLLDVDGEKVTYDKKDLSVGPYPYNVQVTADGRFALTANQGNGGVADGGAGSVTVIDLKATPPHVVDYVGINPVPEGLDVSPRGNLAVALALNGSGAVPKGVWYAHPKTIIEVLSTATGKVRKVSSVNAGGLAEGVAFSPDGKYLYAANFNDNNVQIYRVNGDKIVDTGKSLKLPGHPASMRSSVP